MAGTGTPRRKRRGDPIVPAIHVSNLARTLKTWMPGTRPGMTNMNAVNSPLLTDLYQLNMIQAYLDHGSTDTAVFEFFARTLPARRGFLLAAGLEQALDFLENLRFTADQIAC